MQKWYLRSYDDGDTHCGRVNDDATVTARCGVTFMPLARMFGEGPAVVRPPVDPVAACPKCQVEATKTEDPDGVAVQELVETLSAPRPRRKRFRFWAA